ncbi:hypothetical protein FLAN108750_03570 [Flavobacterium antarcticum]|uniref:hypothetical protein n=1 Tax=Flavobacterium antarcticum TaxID=271155 RepID=UPI0003B70F5C|nr:hypothetical protein [Flavobacterium antarcticum]
MKKQQLFLGFILITLLSLLSCSNEEDAVSVSTTKKNLIGSWTKAKVEKRTNEGQWTDITENCNLDDVEEYASNSNWTFYLGTLRCESGAPVLKGSWNLAANDTKIIYEYDDYEGQYEKSIETITENVLIVTHSANDLANSQYRYTFNKLE